MNDLLFSGIFSRAEQRVMRTIFTAMTEDRGKCAVPLTMLAHKSNASRSTVRNTIARAVAIGLLKKSERRFQSAVSLPNVLLASPAPDRVSSRGASGTSGH